MWVCSKLVISVAAANRLNTVIGISLFFAATLTVYGRPNASVEAYIFYFRFSCFLLCVLSAEIVPTARVLSRPFARTGVLARPRSSARTRVLARPRSSARTRALARPCSSARTRALARPRPSARACLPARVRPSAGHNSVRISNIPCTKPRRVQVWPSRFGGRDDGGDSVTTRGRGDSVTTRGRGDCVTTRGRGDCVTTRGRGDSVTTRRCDDATAR